MLSAHAASRFYVLWSRRLCHENFSSGRMVEARNTRASCRHRRRSASTLRGETLYGSIKHECMKPRHVVPGKVTLLQEIVSPRGEMRATVWLLCIKVFDWIVRKLFSILVLVDDTFCPVFEHCFREKNFSSCRGVCGKSIKLRSV